jgi:hypothetical protein
MENSTKELSKKQQKIRLLHEIDTLNVLIRDAHYRMAVSLDAMKAKIDELELEISKGR